MPWHIESDTTDCGGYAVIKTDDDSLAGCHDTRTDAEAQVAALYASEADKADTPPDVKYPKLWIRAREEARRKYRVYPSAYANGWLVQRYGQLVRERHGDDESGYTSGKSVDAETLIEHIDGDADAETNYKNLTEWFAEQWVDISRPKEGGGYEPCGRPTDGMSEDDYLEAYPKCLPKSRAENLSEAERQRLIRRKRRTGLPEDGKPVMTSSETKATRRYTYNGVTVQASPRRPSSREDKKYMRTVLRNGKEYLVHYGDPELPMQRDIPERRENFLARHSCGDKRDPLAPGFWACYDWYDTDEGKNTVKALGMTADELRIGNYMVLWGGRDLEGLASHRRNPDGSLGEFFTAKTVFESPYTQADILAVDWEHGYAPSGEPGPDDVLGRVDWKTAVADEKGLFVERVLNRRNKYVRFLEELIRAGLIGTSTEAIPDGVVKAANGEIVAWPLRRDTLTVQPMDPRMIDDNVVAAVKSLGIDNLLMASCYDCTEAAPEADKKSAAAAMLDELDRMQQEFSK